MLHEQSSFLRQYHGNSSLKFTVNVTNSCHIVATYEFKLHTRNNHLPLSSSLCNISVKRTKVPTYVSEYRVHKWCLHLNSRQTLFFLVFQISIYKLFVAILFNSFNVYLFSINTMLRDTVGWEFDARTELIASWVITIIPCLTTHGHFYCGNKRVLLVVYIYSETMQDTCIIF